MSSRLFQEIREKRGLVYSVGSALTHYAGAGAFSVYAGCSKKRVPEVLRLIRERARPGGRRRASRAEEVARGRGQLKGGLVLGLEDTGSRMSRLGKSELSYGEYLPVREVLARLDAVDEEQVRVGRRRAVQPGDLPGRGRALPRVRPRPALTRSCALRCRSTAPSRGARSPSPSSCRWRCCSRRPTTSRSRPPGVDKLVHGALFLALALTGRWAGIGRRVLAAAAGRLRGGQRGAAGDDGRWTHGVRGRLGGRRRRRPAGTRSRGRRSAGRRGALTGGLPCVPARRREA